MSGHRAAPQTWWCCSADYPNHEPNCPNDEDVPTPLAAVYADSEFPRGYQEAKQPPVESGPWPEAREYDRLSDRLRDSGLPELECAEGQSCGSLNALRALLDQLQTLREENARLNRIIEITNRHVERILPCPDCRDKVKQGECERCARQRAEARAERAEQSLREKDAEIERLRREKRDAEADGWCDACCGTGKPADGSACMCGGTGKAAMAVTYLRERMLKQERESAEQERTLREALADTTAMCRSAATWPADDTQGMRFHALEAAKRGAAALSPASPAQEDR